MCFNRRPNSLTGVIDVVDPVVKELGRATELGGNALAVPDYRGTPGSAWRGRCRQTYGIRELVQIEPVRPASGVPCRSTGPEALGRAHLGHQLGQGGTVDLADLGAGDRLDHAQFVGELVAGEGGAHERAQLG